MIKERADELVAALRSGKYKQTSGQLRRQDKFCCLGVACDISGLGQWRVPRWEGDSEMTLVEYVVGLERKDTILPYPVREYFGFSSARGDFDDQTSLTSMNDAGKSFFEIADFIEQNWEQL